MIIMKKHCLLILLLLCALASDAQYRTQVLHPDVRSLRVRYLSDAWEQSKTPQRPYLVLTEGRVEGDDPANTLEISFDELSHDLRQYSYRVLHCNRDWTPSDISSYEYVDGFTTADIIAYDHSVNTQQAYTHYSLEFPNQDMQLKASGNYVLQIYQDGDQEQVVAQVCFSVVEPLVGIDLTLRPNTDIELNGRYQQLDVDLQTALLELRTPQELCLVVTQNGRIDNQVVLQKPTFVEPKRLRYTNQRALIFEAGNEFRHFDMYSIYYAGYHIDRLIYKSGEYHALLDLDDIRGTLSPDAAREGLPYLSDLDADGQWLVNCEKTDYPDTDAEYIWVHFSLPVKQYLTGTQVYVGGDWCYNAYNASNLMQYDAEHQCYYLSAYLKQGGYNYMYYTTTDGKHFSSLPIEGSHWQTQNEYMVDAYYRPFGARYDRLVGRVVYRNKP